MTCTATKKRLFRSADRHGDTLPTTSVAYFLCEQSACTV